MAIGILQRETYDMVKIMMLSPPSPCLCLRQLNMSRKRSYYTSTTSSPSMALIMPEHRTAYEFVTRFGGKSKMKLKVREFGQAVSICLTNGNRMFLSMNEIEFEDLISFYKEILERVEECKRAIINTYGEVKEPFVDLSSKGDSIPQIPLSAKTKKILRRVKRKLEEQMKLDEGQADAEDDDGDDDDEKSNPETSKVHKKRKVQFPLEVDRESK